MRPERWLVDTVGRHAQRAGIGMPEVAIKAPRGRYRVIAFIVIDFALTQEKKEPTRAEAMGWF